MAAAASSPASSPRLPSPPPIAEDQIGPTSPGLSLYEDHGKLAGTNSIDTGTSRRIRPGTKAEDMAEGPPLVELQDIDSAFQLTEHLKAKHYSFTHPVDSDSTIPISADLARELSQPPPNTSKEIWLYELGRFLIQKTNAIIVGLFADNPACSPLTCSEMRASEWQYLCAVHDPPKSCSAIDYCCHTLDWAATTLTSSKMFPSRLGLGSGNLGVGNDKMLQQQLKEITNIFRRVYRIYAHAWFQHREMFWRVEGKTGLYVFFKTVCDEYGMIQAENYTIPPEAEGREEEAESTPLDSTSQSIPALLRREVDGDEAGRLNEPPHPEPVGNTVTALGDTTKRHRHTRSDLGNSLATVIQEEVEEDEADQPLKPGVERQLTALRSLDIDAAGEDSAKTGEDAAPSMDSVDTSPSSREEHDDSEPRDVTVIGPDAEFSHPESGLLPAKAEIVEPRESAEAEGDEAGKTSSAD